MANSMMKFGSKQQSSKIFINGAQAIQRPRPPGLKCLPGMTPHSSTSRFKIMTISQNENGLLNQEGHITGLEGISTERTLELIPSITVSETGKRVPALTPAQLNENPSLVDPGHFVNPPPNFDLGLTAKFSITP